VIQFHLELEGGELRGVFQDQGKLFSYVSPEPRVPADHPLRKIRELVRDALKELNRSFSRLYAKQGRPSVPPEQRLSALLLQALYGIRSERQLMEQLDYNFLYRWFVGLSPDDAVWAPTSFTKSRDARCQRVCALPLMQYECVFGQMLCGQIVQIGSPRRRILWVVSWADR
jgi:transposase